MRSNEDFTHASRTVTGHVKWFDRGKGYGFVVAPNIEGDILLHANVLRNFGQNSVSEGSSITIEVVGTDRGMQAQEVIGIEAPLDNRPSDEGFLDDIAAPLEPARVKWFDKAKGYGFANVFGQDNDVYIHIEVLRRSSLADLQPGEAIAIRVTEGERGCQAIQVSVWEDALSKRASPSH